MWSLDVLLIIGAERGFVHVPEQMVGGVRVNRDADGRRGGRRRGRWEGEKRNGSGERVLSVVSKLTRLNTQSTHIAAVGVIEWGSRGGGGLGGVGSVVVDGREGDGLLRDTASGADR